MQIAVQHFLWFHLHGRRTPNRGVNEISRLLDPVGSLVSTLLVVGCWLVGHTFSKFVHFECVGVLVC